MAALSEAVVVSFCKLCDWTYEVWLTHRTLYDDNADVDALMTGPYSEVFARLNHVSREYVLHQIVKLHDRPVQRDCINLSLRYVIDYGGWDGGTLAELEALFGKLEALASCIRLARNKLLSHNSLETILKDEPLGTFAKDDDCRYFETLQKFVDVVHDKVVGGPYPFNDLARSDAKFLLNTLRTESGPLSP